MTSEGSDETVHKYILVKIFPAHWYTIRGLNDQRRLRWDCEQVQSRQNLPCSLTYNMESKWPAKAQMRLCRSTVSSESPLLTYTQYGDIMTSEGSDETVHKCSLVRISPAHLHTIWSLNDQRRFRWDCVQVHSRQKLPCSLTHNMEPKWPAKVQMRLCASTFSSETPLLTYTQYRA